jgi:hypothetical protein
LCDFRVKAIEIRNRNPTSDVATAAVVSLPVAVSPRSRYLRLDSVGFEVAGAIATLMSLSSDVRDSPSALWCNPG